MIRAVGFDLGDTLIEYEGIPMNWQQEYSSALTAVAGTWSTAASESIAAGSTILERFNTRLAPREQEVGHEAVFSELLLAMGVPSGRVDSLIDPAVDAFFGHFRRHVRPMPAAIKVVETLSAAEIPAGVLTDVPYGMPRHLALADLEACGLGALAPSALTSVDVGYRKPHRSGFLALASLLGCQPGDVLFIGNEQKDVTGAVRAGMRSALLWRDGCDTPDWGQDVTILGLDAVPGLVRESAV
ncbi:MAG: HAD family hydrolase [Coriobacteriia bacterium]